MSDVAHLIERLERLETCESIRQLKARYAALADDKYTADYRPQEPARLKALAVAQAACFTTDAIWHGAEFGGDRVGREALAHWFEHSPWCYAAHYYVGADIAVDGQRASADWRLWQLALRADNGEAVLLIARTEESYRCSDTDGWLIDSMAFRDVQVTALGNGSLPLAPGLEALRALRTH